jgi:hypothetical protein
MYLNLPRQKKSRREIRCSPTGSSEFRAFRARIAIFNRLS